MSIAEPGELRVVLDTNIYISAFVYPRGRISRLWRMALSGLYRLLVSPAIVNEIADVLRSKFAWDDHHIVGRLKLLTKAAEIVVPTSRLRVIQEDDDDNRILECAVDGKADVIVSGDHHIRDLKSVRGIGIAGPVEFEHMLGTIINGLRAPE